MPFWGSKKRTQKFYYRSNLSITTLRAGNLVCVRKNDQGKYVVYANGTKYNQFCVFKETNWSSKSPPKITCYIRWSPPNDPDTEYELAVKNGKLKLVNEKLSKKCRKFRILPQGRDQVAFKSVATKQYISCDTKTTELILATALSNSAFFKRESATP